jgi:hypothetical protein
MKASFQPLRVFLFAAILLTVNMPVWSAQAQEASENPPRPYVSVGTVEGSPGASLIVPLYYTADPKISIRSFTIEIEYVSNNLEFQSAVKGIVDQDALEISSSVVKGTADAKGVTKSQLRLTIALRGDNSERGLDEGLLSYLMFQLSVQAKPFVIKLTPTILSAEDSQRPARKVSNLSARPGAISVLSMDVTPETTCFFFSH